MEDILSSIRRVIARDEAPGTARAPSAADDVLDLAEEEADEAVAETSAADELVSSKSADAARQSGRDPGEITRIVVTKFHPAELVRELHALGVRELGENRQQELTAKRAALEDLEDLRWHFIGQAQTNKAAAIRHASDVVHSVDRTRLADALHRPLRGDECRRNRVAADTALAVFEGDLLGQRAHTALGRRVGGQAGIGNDLVDRREVHDGAAARLLHVGHRRPAEPERRAQRGVHGAGPFLVRGGRNAALGVLHRVVDQHVHPAEALQGAASAGG